jgi:hypothetical protein
MRLGLAPISTVLGLSPLLIFNAAGLPIGSIGMPNCSARGVTPGWVDVGFSLPPQMKLPRSLSE